ncbi:MAG: BON domain-containing protein [Candidatus Hydrogenedentota bacterium]
MSIVSLLVAATLVAPGQLDKARGVVTDSAITARIETTFTFNEHLNPYNIDTVTENGAVTLMGGVNAELQRELAGDIAASVRGVTSVDNQIMIMPDSPPDKPYRSWRTKVDDRTISVSVRTRLMYRKTLRGEKIKANTEVGVVTLTGIVDSDFQKEQAEYVAFQTKGVKRVVNNLTVRTKEDLSTFRNIGREVSDEFVEKRVEKSIVLNRHLSVRTIDVEVDDGVCYLTGIVNSDEERQLAAQVAMNTRGVKHVRNDISVYSVLPEPMGIEPLEPFEGDALIEPLEAEPLELLSPTQAPRADVFGDPNAPLFSDEPR